LNVTGGGWKTNLSNADLSNADLSNISLKKANFTGAKLAGATQNNTPVTKKWLAEQGAENTDSIKDIE
jgi:uncharacterized protein YjbI with pentapeptide repeats